MHAYFNAMRHYADPSGRASRAEFWSAHLVFLPLILIAFGVFGLPFTGGSRSVWPLLFFVLIVVPHIVPWAALMVRRLHDMDFRGWWGLIGLVPVLSIVPLGIVVLLAWACLRGTPGPNRFGPGSLGRDRQRASFVVASSAIGATPPTMPVNPLPGDPIAEIERLARLRTSGALSQTEFEALKAKALAGTGRA